MIGRLSADETRLDRQLQEKIARQTIVVDKNLEELRGRIAAVGNFFTRFGRRIPEGAPYPQPSFGTRSGFELWIVIFFLKRIIGAGI